MAIYVQLPGPTTLLKYAKNQSCSPRDAGARTYLPKPRTELEASAITASSAVRTVSCSSISEAPLGYGFIAGYIVSCRAEQAP